ncbi:MAG: Cna B-type domain-containing protein, partial [Clostridiales bacterium]|nr:Cna B-type domain-containing protein [Clostridiales bacterium]
MKTRKAVRWIGALLAIMLVMFGMVSGAAAEENFEQDGSKIEGIDLFWLTPDSTVDNEGHTVPQAEQTDNGSDRHNHLYLATRSDDPLSMTYQFEISFSGQYDYAPGDIQVTIPAQVWHARDTSDEAAGRINPNKMIGSMELSVPAAPSTRADFNWQLINGNYVLTNTKTIGATSKAMFQMSITNLVPHNVVDMSECDPITVHVDVVTNRGNVISRTSEAITAQIDTIAEIRSAYKSTNNELYEDVPASIPAGLLANLPEGADPEDYIYVRWYSYVYHRGNQPFSLDIEDTVSAAYRQIKDASGKVTGEEFVTDGILLGFTNYEGKAPATGDHDLEANILKNTYHTDTTTSYDHTVYMWSAYKKSDFYVPTAKEPQVVYVMRNNIDWILTEYDAEAADPGYGKPLDAQKVTIAPAQASVFYMPTRWSKPTGHFEVFKWTENQPNEDWNYGYGLNQLIDGEDVSMNFHLKTVGFGYPWTSVRTNPDDPEYVGEEDVKAEDFGNLGWRQITEDFDTFFDNNDTPLTERDFEITSMRVTVPSKLRYQKAGYPRYGYYELNGNIVYGQMPASQYGYFSDSSLPTPDLQIEYQLNGDGQWRHAATANWGDNGKGAFRFMDVAEGITTSGMTVYFPENTTDVRHIFVSNVYNGKSAAKCDLGAVQWDVYLGIDLKASEKNIAIAENWFKLTDTPSTKFRNDVHMFVDGWIKANADGTPGEGVRLYPDHPNAFFDTSRATIAGASYGVSLSKKVDFDNRSLSNGGDNDVEYRRAILHYSAEVSEQSNLINRTDYDKAVEEGVIPAETRGVWYDLLPLGVTPLMDTIQLRDDDVITSKYTIPDYKGTGRILLVVEADLTPDPVQKYSGSKPVGYVDKPSIKFDAVYTWDAIKDYGIEADNYIAFESKVDNLRYDTLGTITGQRGNPDDPTAGNNNTTPSMPADIAQAMTDLDPNTDESRFVYGKAPVRLDLITSALSGIAKAVQNDLEGVWTQGLADQDQVTVYEGQSYTYRLRVSSSESTVTSDIVIYDTIENYHIPDPEDDETQDATKAEDYNDKERKKNWQGDWQGVGQWRGTLESVDLSEFVADGVAPVLYYSLMPDLTFADSTPDMSQDERLELFSKGAYDLTDADIWHRAELTAEGKWNVPADVYGKISAVALDARRTADGAAYVLGEGEAVSGYLHMVAPDDNSDPDVWHAKGAYAHKTDGNGNPIQEVDWEAAMEDPANNMYAFNNTRLKCVQTGTGGTGVGESSNIMIRNDYTRVGILPSILKVEKVWKDQNNHDNIRPDEVTVILLRKAIGLAGDFEEVTDASGAPMTVTLNGANNWTDYFYQVDVVDEDGNQYVYSFRENEIEGYTLTVRETGDGQYILTNSHPNEQVELKGEKQWNDDDNALGLRPESITVKLYRDGEYVKKQTVTPSGGSWTYNFGKLDKYEQGGREYRYTVEEDYVPKYVASSDSYKLLVNDYAPFGDLSVLKTLKEATPKAAENEFTFTIKLLAEQTDPAVEPAPLMDEYAYELFRLGSDGESWQSVSTGTLTCSSTFVLKGDEKIVIYDLPSESTYEIEEAEKEGFALTGKVNDKGVIRAGQTVGAEFINTYSASGGTQFNASKGQTGHGLRKNQHQFQIVDMTEGSATYGQVIRTAYSGTPVNEQDDETGVITAEAVAAFGQLDYTHRDDGKTFTYEVVEVDAEKPGYTYDETRYTVTVTVEDNGDGTMTVTALDGNGNDVTAADGSGMSFDNEYHAEGEITLKAWKVLEKRELKAGEFTFELYKYDNATGETVGDPIATATNDAEGNVVFPAIRFDQDDVSLDDANPAKYYFLAKEKVGNDATVVYSDQVYKYEVTAYDNNDGTLSFVEGTQQGTREINECATCGSIEKKGVPHVSLSGQDNGSGYYSVYSYGYGPASETDPTDCAACSNGCEACEYTGHKLVDYPAIGTTYYDGALRTEDYTVKAVGYMTLPEAVDDYTSSLNRVANLTYAVYFHDYGEKMLQYNMRPYYELKRVFNSEDLATLSGTSFSRENYLAQFERLDYTPVLDNCPDCNGSGHIEGGVTVTGEQSMPVFVNDIKPGVLTINKSVNNNPNPDPDQEFTFKVRFTGEMKETPDFTRTTSGSVSTPTTPAQNSQVFHASSSELWGNAYAVIDKSTGVLTFFRSNGSYDHNGNYFYMGSSTRKEVGNKVYYTVSEASTTLMGSGTFGVSTTDAPYVKAVTMVNAVRPRWMEDWFYGLTNLETVDLSMMDTSLTTNMRYLFSGCTSLKTIDLSTFDTSSVQYFAYMFRGCSNLETANLCNFTTQRISSLYYPGDGGMAGMFSNCSSLKELDMGRIERVVQGGSMFTNCPALEILDLGSLSSPEPYMFGTNGCPNLKVYTRAASTYFSYYPRTSVPHDYWVDENGTTWPNSQVFGGSGPSGTLELWHPSYAMTIDPNGGAGSNITYYPRDCDCDGATTITPMLYRFGYRLAGLSYNGTTYPLEGGVVTLPAGIAGGNSQISMTAVWEQLDASESTSDNVAVFTMKAGDTVTFANLPAYTGYEVWEETPDGWVLVHKINDVGEIAPLSTRWANFTNEYRTNEAQVIFRASKMLDDKAAKAESFQFILKDAQGNRLQTVKNKDGGAVQFAAIAYDLDDAGKTFTYTISEDTSYYNYDITGLVPPQIVYDTSIYTATVAVKDNGNGVLSATVTYKDAAGNVLDNPPVFRNETGPGALRLVKGVYVPGTMKSYEDCIAGTDFTFEVTLKDVHGTPWAGDEDGNVSLERYVYDENGKYNSTPITETYPVVNGVVRVPMDSRTSNAVLYDIPDGIRYEVKETGTYPGWEMVQASAVTGTITPYYGSVSSHGITATIVNNYTHKGTAVLEAQKILEGRTPREGEFTFRLLDSQGNVIDETTNEAGTGLVVFDELPYDKEGTYEYTIREVKGEDDTVEYSDEVISVTVVMEDKEGEGRLTPTITYAGNKNTITNKVKPGSLKISKTVVSSYEGHAEKEFTFTLYLTDALGQMLSGEYGLSNGETLTMVNGSGELKLKGGETVTITGLPDGASYSVVEAAEGGFAQKSSGATGKIWANETATAAFTNTYHAEGEYVFTAVKTLEGKELAADQFVFELYDSEGYVLESVLNDAQGNVTFKTLEFTEEDVGSRSYTISERNTGEAGVTYDGTLYEITLTITDDGDGTLEVEAEGIPEEGMTFVNTYSNETEITATKEWKGDEENKDARREITLSLYGKAGTLTKKLVDVRTIPADAEGDALTVKWEELPVFEVQDGKAVEIRYSVEETMAYGEDEKNPYLSAVMETTGEGFTVINRYNSVTVELPGLKTLEGRELAEGEFSFALYDEAGNELARAVNDEAGRFSFKLDYMNSNSQSDLGRHTYTVKELKGALESVTYDETVYTVEVTVAENDEGTLTAEPVITRDGEAVEEIAFENKLKTTLFTVRKSWQGGGGGAIELTLYANG